jgi:hypothetical protein
MDVMINETAVRIPRTVSTWGDLLDWLETDYLKSGQCITRVFLNGNEEVNYRSSLVCDRELNAVGNINVESGDFDRVVRESLEELDRELKICLEASRDIVRLFESRNEETAFNQLAQLLDSIRIFFTVFSEDLGWADAPDAEVSREEFSAAMERALTQLIAAQQTRHWVAICDVLEYEINPLLESWQKLVEGTRVRIN